MMIISAPLSRLPSSPCFNFVNDYFQLSIQKFGSRSEIDIASGNRFQHRCVCRHPSFDEAVLFVQLLRSVPFRTAHDEVILDCSSANHSHTAQQTANPSYNYAFSLTRLLAFFPVAGCSARRFNGCPRLSVNLDQCAILYIRRIQCIMARYDRGTLA